VFSCGNIYPDGDACRTLMILALTCSYRTPAESVLCPSEMSELYAGTDE